MKQQVQNEGFLIDQSKNKKQIISNDKHLVAEFLWQLTANQLSELIFQENQNKNMFLEIMNFLVILKDEKANYQYDEASINQFKIATQDKNQFLKPHLWKKVHQALQQLKISNKSSIVITGPSSSGKTFTTKRIIEYIVSFDSQVETQTQMIAKTTLAVKVNHLLSILESFGNAQTQQNPNSSRFGNNIQIFYSHQQKLVSGRVQINQFEKSRVVKFNQQLEKNFHVFYYLVAAYERRNQLNEYFTSQEETLDPDLFDSQENWIKYLEGLQLPQKCEILGQQYIGDQDHKYFIDLLNHLYNFEFEENDIFAIFDCIAGLIHLKQDNYEQANKLLKMDVLKKELFETGGGSTLFISVARNAESPKDGYIMDMYHNLFKWIEKKINQNLQNENPIDTSKHKQLNIYDSFGFESIANPQTKEHQNGLQQLLLNYTNEKLQQFIYAEIKKKEKLSMESEGLPYEEENFLSNNTIIEFFDQYFVKEVGDLTKLSRADQNPNSNLLKKIIDLSKTPKFKNSLIITENLQKSILGQLSEVRKIHRLSKQMFGVFHTNGEIFYKIEGMINSNKIGISDKLRNTYSKSQNAIIKQFNTSALNQTQLEVTIQQLELLTDNLKQSETFFIKCVTNNAENIQETLDKDILAYMDYYVRNYQYKVKLDHFLSYYLVICNGVQTLEQLKQLDVIQTVTQIKFGNNHIFLTVKAKQQLDILEANAKQQQLEASQQIANIEQLQPCQLCIQYLSIIQQYQQQIQELSQKNQQYEEIFQNYQNQQSQAIINSQMQLSVQQSGQQEPQQQLQQNNTEDQEQLH